MYHHAFALDHSSINQVTTGHFFSFLSLFFPHSLHLFFFCLCSLLFSHVFGLFWPFYFILFIPIIIFFFS